MAHHYPARQRDDPKDDLWGLLGGSGDLVSKMIMGIIRVTIWVIGVSDLLTKFP